MKTREELLNLLNAENALENLKELIKTEELPEVSRDVNNHIHTTYSFSPYSPPPPYGSPAQPVCAPAA